MSKPKAESTKRGLAALPSSPKDYKNQAVSVLVSGEGGAQFAAAVAKKLTRPEVSAAAIIESWQKDTHDVNELVTELSRQVEAVNSGDLARAEGMLIAQAHALDNIFSNLARRATSQDYLKQWEAYMRMAMRAQNQCRLTLETLAAIKNPPVVFARQANINNGGQQQVNNGSAVPNGHQASHASKDSFEPSKLLEESDVERVDTGAPGTAGAAHQDVETVGAFNRT
jgi:hypothetical protein